MPQIQMIYGPHNRSDFVLLEPVLSERLREIRRNTNNIHTILEYVGQDNIEFQRFRDFFQNENEETDIEMAESYLKRAWHKQDEAKERLMNRHYSESISSSQECIELSIKSIFLLLQEKYQKRHDFKEKEFIAIIEKVPDKLKYLNFPKLFLYSKFWQDFYLDAKYGLEQIGVGPEKLFEKEEAELALKHADKCRYAAGQLENYIKHPW